MEDGQLNEGDEVEINGKRFKVTAVYGRMIYLTEDHVLRMGAHGFELLVRHRPEPYSEELRPAELSSLKIIKNSHR